MAYKAFHGFSSIFLTDEMLDRVDRASRLAGYDSIADFCREVITQRADELLMAKKTKLPRGKKAKR